MTAYLSPVSGHPHHAVAARTAVAVAHDLGLDIRIVGARCDVVLFVRGHVHVSALHRAPLHAGVALLGALFSR